MLEIFSSSIFCEQIFVQHGPITIAIDCNGHSLLIFEAEWPNYASGLKSAPNSDSFWVCRFFNVCVRGFCASNATILLVYIPAKITKLNGKIVGKYVKRKIKMIGPKPCQIIHLKRFFFAKIGIFCKSIAGSRSPALFKHIHNYIRSAEG